MILLGDLITEYTPPARVVASFQALQEYVHHRTPDGYKFDPASEMRAAWASRIICPKHGRQVAVVGTCPLAPCGEPVTQGGDSMKVT